MILSLPLNISQAISQLPDNPFYFTDLATFISQVIGIVIVLSGVACLIYLLWGGLQWVVSGGDKTGLENARNMIMHAIVGLIIVVSAWAIFNFVQDFLHLNFTERTQGPGVQSFSSGGGGSGGGGGGGGGSGGNTGGNNDGLLRCPGPNCDRCPNRPGSWNPVPTNDPQWKTSAQCP